MEPTYPATQRRGLTAIDGAIAFIAVLLIVQMWLLSATLNQYLAGDRGVTVPAAIASGILFLACVGLYLFIERVDKTTREQPASPPAETA